MEIIIDNVKYTSSIQNESLNNVSYTFNNGITFCSGLRGSIIKELLFLEKETSNGYIYLDKKGYRSDIAYLSNKQCEFNKDNLLDELIYLSNLYSLNTINIKEKAIKAVKMVNLNSKMLYKSFNIMSNVELKLSQLVISLFLNAKIFILDNFEKNFTYKNVEYIKKLLYKLNKSYNKSVIIFSNNIELFMNIIDNIIIFKNGKIVYRGDKSNLYDNNLYKYIDKPDIIQFVNYLELKGHKFDNYIDLKELLKAIYRDVENK